jgi:hypothetical protein
VTALEEHDCPPFRPFDADRRAAFVSRPEVSLRVEPWTCPYTPKSSAAARPGDTIADGLMVLPVSTLFLQSRELTTFRVGLVSFALAAFVDNLARPGCAWPAAAEPLALPSSSAASVPW